MLDDMVFWVPSRDGMTKIYKILCNGKVYEAWSNKGSAEAALQVQQRRNVCKN